MNIRKINPVSRDGNAGVGSGLNVKKQEYATHSKNASITIDVPGS